MRIISPARPAALAMIAVVVSACSGVASPAPASAPSSAAPSAAATSTPEATEEPSESVAPEFELADVQESVAYVETQGTFVLPEGAQEGAYTGTAFLIDDDGHLVTNNHVVTGGAFWKVTVNEETHDARLVGSSECHDLAVLKIDAGDDLTPLSWSSEEPRVGETIFVAGHPNGDTYTLTDGIVAKSGEPSESSWTSIKEELQITAQTYPGNSGSPVVNEEGGVVGVHYAGGVRGSDIEGQSFAISAEEAEPVVERLMDGENVEYIGINGEAIAEAGIWVISVAPGSPASETGIVAGDVVTKLSGTSVGVDGTKSNYCSVLRSHDADDVLSVEVVRGDEVFTGEINGKELTATRVGGNGGNGGGGSGSIDQLAAYIPDDYYGECEPSDEPYYEDSIESAYCNVPGVGIDAMWYDLFPDQASLVAALETDVSDLDAVEGSCADAGEGTSIVNTYTITIGGTEVGSDDHRILCWTNDDGAWMEQADPYVYVIWTGLQEDGDIGALAAWWAENPTILSATEPQ